MSWSFSAIGTPDNLIKALDATSETMSGDSKDEFDQAKPNLQSLLAMNVNKNSPPVLHLNANGHASRSEGEVYHGSCNVEIKGLSAQLV